MATEARSRWKAAGRSNRAVDTTASSTAITHSTPLCMPERGKPCIERKREQKTEDHLNAHRGDPKLLQQLHQIAVVALRFRFPRTIGGDHEANPPAAAMPVMIPAHLPRN